MKKETLIAIAAALSAIALEITGEEPADNENGGGEGQDAPKKRGRPPGSTSKEPTNAGKTLDELREIVRPLLEEGRNDEVKKVVAKYTKVGGVLKDLPAEHHAAFIKDIEALTV